jgi:hypothetical protein
LAILSKTKVDNSFKAVSAERYSVSVRQNKVKKKQNRLQSQEKMKSDFVSNEGTDDLKTN